MQIRKRFYLCGSFSRGRFLHRRYRTASAVLDSSKLKYGDLRKIRERDAEKRLRRPRAETPLFAALRLEKLRFKANLYKIYISLARRNDRCVLRIRGNGGKTNIRALLIAKVPRASDSHYCAFAQHFLQRSERSDMELKTG